jgi:predicted RNA binding protein YcfA (HicA-like mRNA interferase family)
VKVPRDLSSTQLIRLLSNFGYEITRQTGSHIRYALHPEQENLVAAIWSTILRSRSVPKEWRG